jgi:hypothetical protein
MYAGTGTEERKTWMIIVGFLCGIIGMVIAFSSATTWLFSLGILVAAIGIFFLVMGLRSGMKYRNKTLADGLLIAVVILDMFLIYYFLSIL